ncbi:MAG: Arylsulfatase [Firmicutes bacterium ADurb.Bin193]|nr:MAG: Arylsulfatase [Firmicutes bacterium ADurb.Bin193]
MKDKPNIVFILTDDQGYWALGCNGNSEIRTPNLDALARDGIRFENFFCTSPVCSPARASILTGKIPSQHGVHDWIVGGNGESDNIDRGGTKERIEYLKGQTGYTDILAQNGYICGISGKWHLGDSHTPQKSFSHWFVFGGGASKYFNAVMINEKGESIEVSEYLTDVITDDAIGFIEKNAGGDKPFYISVHYNAPHRPWINNHPKELVESYDDCPFESCPSEPMHPWLTHWRGANGDRDDAPDRECLKEYFAAVTAMDANVGRIMKKLDELGIRENTLVCFMSDNGLNCGHHGIWGKGNGTFPQNMYDTSVKVPFIVSHPGRIPKGVVCDSLLSQYDFMPTLLDYVGLKNPESDKLPGKSFLPILEGGNMDGHEHLVVFDEYGPVRMIRTREWKYIHRYPYGPCELYDLVADPDERNNLIDDKSKEELIISMRGEMEKWFLKYADPEVDAKSAGVTGTGQKALAGVKSNGKSPYAQLAPIQGPKPLY